MTRFNQPPLPYYNAWNSNFRRWEVWTAAGDFVCAPGSGAYGKIEPMTEQKQQDYAFKIVSALNAMFFIERGASNFRIDPRE